MVPAPFFKNDVEILNYALTLEHLEADFYVKVIRDHSAVLRAGERTTFTVIRDHEVAHVTALTNAIQAAGGIPVKPRQSYDFRSLGDINTRDGILTISAALEHEGVGAYDGVAFELKNKAYLAVAGQIVQVEARHTAAINAIIGTSPTPSGPFEWTLRPGQVFEDVGKILGPVQ